MVRDLRPQCVPAATADHLRLVFFSDQRRAIRAAPCRLRRLAFWPFDAGPPDFSERAAGRARAFPNAAIRLRVEPRDARRRLIERRRAADDLAAGEGERPFFGQRDRVALGTDLDGVN